MQDLKNTEVVVATACTRLKTAISDVLILSDVVKEWRKKKTQGRGVEVSDLITPIASIFGFSSSEKNWNLGKTFEVSLFWNNKVKCWRNLSSTLLSNNSHQNDSKQFLFLCPAGTCKSQSLSFALASSILQLGKEAHLSLEMHIPNWETSSHAEWYFYHLISCLSQEWFLTLLFLCQCRCPRWLTITKTTIIINKTIKVVTKYK